MNARARSVFRLAVVMLALALGVVYSGNAQSASLTQLASTSDGQISAHIPQNWLSSSTNATIYSTVLAVGDSAATLQAALNSINTTQTTVIPGMYGYVAILSPQIVGQIAPDQVIFEVYNSLTNGLAAQGGSVLEESAQQVGDQYPSRVAVAEVPGLQAKGIVGVFQAGATIGIVELAASPQSNFDAYRSLFFDIMYSIRIPAEAGGSAAPTPVPQAQPSVQGGVTASPTAEFSVRLPDGYVNEALTVTNFNDSLAFGSDQASMQAAVDSVVNGQPLKPIAGVGGWIGVIDATQLGGQALDPLVAQLMGRLLTLATQVGAQQVGQTEAHSFGGQYSGQLATLNDGFIAVMHTDQALLVAVVLGDNVSAYGDVMTGILESIRIPAEASALPPPTETAPAEPQTVRSSDTRVSLVIPGNWTVIDDVADHDILAYGDSEDAANSRLFSAKPGLAVQRAITGSGGLIILYPMSQFNIDPNKPDLSALMAGALQQLQGQGYTVEQAAQPLEGSSGGLYAIISGTERGYLALIPFSSEIAYVTATGTQDTFQANSDLLLNIVKSVHIPAALEATPVPGLGGLGGLPFQATPEVTEAAPASPPPPGLGGL